MNTAFNFLEMLFESKAGTKMRNPQAVSAREK